jgi:hypothetical protein
VLASGRLAMQYNDQPLVLPFGEPNIRISFPLKFMLEARPALRYLREILKENSVDWLYVRQGAWYLDFDALLRHVPVVREFSWMTGTIAIVPDIVVEQTPYGTVGTILRFIVTEEEAAAAVPKKIFLSHKGFDKPRVREYAKTLSAIGLDPWLDEDAMAAGAELERAILQGMHDSCAAVFFVTPHFEDSGYPGSEVNYAMAEKRAKGARFAIISLVFKGDAGETREVPDLLRQFVWKEPATDPEALREIIRALPLELGPANWKA